jgi:hypothetical protein
MMSWAISQEVTCSPKDLNCGLCGAKHQGELFRFGMQRSEAVISRGKLQPYLFRGDTIHVTETNASPISR